MADTQTSGFTHSLPTRTITITGERTANMVRSTIRVSQIETRIIQMSMVGSSGVVSAVSRATEDFQRAYNAFEASLKAIANDLEVSRRPGARKRGGATQQRPNANAVQSNAPGQKVAKPKGDPRETLKAKPEKAEQAAKQEAKPKAKAPATPKAEPKNPTPAASQVETPALAPTVAATPVEPKAQTVVSDEVKVAAPQSEAPVVPDTLQSL